MYSRSARETLHLLDQAGLASTAPWAVFDPAWYRSRYPDTPDGSAEETLEWHLTRGQRAGHSPNLYFDEMWQRQAWPGILVLIESGSVISAFDAWCRGPHAARAPHWLFEPREYRTHYPALTDEVLEETGFINRYHHYLRFGAAEGRIGHALFDPAIYLAALDPADVAGATSIPFAHYLRGLGDGAPERRTSLLFDPGWYRDRYPDAARSVEEGRYRSLLEHYLCNDQPVEFDPSPWFSEKYYLAQNPGLADVIGPEGFRNGFAHFRAHGWQEGRSSHPDLDLRWYAGRDDVRADIEAGRAREALAHWITIGYPAGLPGRPSPEIQVTEAQAGALHRRRASTIWPLFGRRELDFSHGDKPAISVIMTVRDDMASTMVSLASLRAQYVGELELILICYDPVPPLPTLDIETHVAGATILRLGVTLNDAAARAAGLICASADTVLLLADGIDLAPGAVDNALTRLHCDPAIGAVGGRLIQPHGLLLEAGGIVWRDGHLQPYARDASPLAAEANFVRDTDFCSTLFLLARRDVLASLPDQAAGLAGTTHDAADLCARIQQAGFRVVYEPDAVAFLTNQTSDRRPNGRTAFVAAHADSLARRAMFDPTAVIRARSPRPGRPSVLFIEDSIPLRRIGSGFVRSNDVLRAMVASGASVTVFPMRENSFPMPTIRAELPGTVEVMHDASSSDLADFIATRHDCYDFIWIARTHNLDLVHDRLIEADPASLSGLPFAADPRPSGAPGRFDASTNVVVWDVATPMPGFAEYLGRALSGPDSARPRIIVDTEAVDSVRQAEQATLLDQPFDLDVALRREFRHLDAAMHVVAVTEAEAAIIRPHHRGDINILGHSVTPSPTPRRFEERSGILFVGAIHAMDHPNYDGLVWFIDEILPLIERILRWETRLTVAGYVAPGVSLDRFKGHSRVTLRGAVTDLAPLYDAHRVFVAPARFAAGIPYKVHEAAAHGVPVVTTSLLARQLGWRDAEAIGAADVTDPAGFAARIIALHRDAALWTRLREAALAHVAAELDPDAFASRVASLLGIRKSPVEPVASLVRDC